MVKRTPIENKLIEAAKQGSCEAFDHLMIRYQARVFKLVNRYVNDPSDALDITQDVFLKVLKALPTFRGDCTFYTWLYRISINTAKNYAVAQGRRSVESHLDMQTLEKWSDAKDNVSPEHLLIGNELANKIYLSINVLPDKMRTALLLHEIEGKSYEQIAFELQCPIGTVRSRIFRARESIFKAIQDLL